MSMITKCSACGTVFRVTPQQLQAQHGMVRCGRCAAVFDGFQALTTERDVSPLEAPVPKAVVHEQPDIAEIPTQPADEIPPPSPEPQIEASPPEPAIPTPDTPVVSPESQVTLTKAPIENAPEPQAVFVEAPFENAPVRPRRNTGLALGIFLLLLALLAQGVYFYRGEIAAHLPEARPYLNAVCDQLRCSVVLPQRPRAISIEASDLQATDPANPGLISLTATFRNQATTTLGYPALDVVLTNSKEHAVARRIFLPTEYLGADKDVRAGIPANAEMTVKLDIDSGDLGAAGFRLDLLATPPR